MRIRKRGFLKRRKPERRKQNSSLILGNKTGKLKTLHLSFTLSSFLFPFPPWPFLSLSYLLFFFSSHLSFLPLLSFPFPPPLPFYFLHPLSFLHHISFSLSHHSFSSFIFPSPYSLFFLSHLHFPFLPPLTQVTILRKFPGISHRKIWLKCRQKLEISQELPVKDSPLRNSWDKHHTVARVWSGLEIFLWLFPENISEPILRNFFYSILRKFLVTHSEKISCDPFRDISCNLLWGISRNLFRGISRNQFWGISFKPFQGIFRTLSKEFLVTNVDQIWGNSRLFLKKSYSEPISGNFLGTIPKIFKNFSGISWHILCIFLSKFILYLYCHSNFL